MTRSPAEAMPPDLLITLDLEPVLAAVAASLDTKAHVRHGIERAVHELVETLGIPCHPQIEIMTHAENQSDTHSAPFHLIVGGQLCYFSDDLMLQALSYVEGGPLIAPQRQPILPDWLRESERVPEGRAAELIELVCRGALAQQASLLLGPAQVESYCSNLNLPESVSTERVLPLLRRVVDLGISIADRPTVRRVLLDKFAEGDDAEEVAERLVTALRPAVVGIRVEPGYLRQLTLDNAAKGPEVFPFMRDGLFNELGLTFPDFHLMLDTTLKPGAFAFTVNHLTTLPVIGLPPETILVNDTAERMRLMDIVGKPTSNPATMLPGCLVERTSKDVLEAAGLTTWDQIGYVILCLAAVLRRNGHALVDRELADAMLKQLGRDFPDLERSTRTYVSIDVLTRALRALVTEELSVRNLRRILERLIEYEVAIDANRPNDRIAFVRAGMRDAIAYKYARGKNTLFVYLLDPEMEQSLAAQPTPESARRPPEGLNDALYMKIVDAVRAELKHLPPLAQLPVILTKSSVRAVLRATLAQEFPRLQCVSYADIPPDYNIQPVARISWR